MKGWMALMAVMALRSSLLLAADERKEYIPQAPDYSDATMWICADGDSLGTGADVFYVVSTWEKDWQTADGRICHYADPTDETQRQHMATEINGVARYMSPGNRFYAPYYRHATIEAFLTLNEDSIRQRTRLAMDDVRRAFDHFLRQRDKSRPFIIAGFSQGGMAMVELLKHMDDETYSRMAAAYVMGYKITPEDTAECHRIRPARKATDTGVTICYNTVKDVKYVQPVIANTCAGINPVNWRTDDTPAILHDSITVRLSTERHVLVVSGYSGAEYRPFRHFINVGDIHSCEPWLYSEYIAENMAVRTRQWRWAQRPTLRRILQRDTLLVGTTGDYRPLSYREPASGDYWGFGIELAQAMAERMGVSTAFVPTSWPTLTRDVLSNPQRFDLAIGGITITDVRRAQMLMTDGYLDNGKTILCRKEDARRYRSLKKLNRRRVRVMVNPGGLNEKFARERLPRATIIVHDRNEDIPARIANGDADVMITEITEAPYYISTDSRLAAPLLHKPFTHGEIGVLMRQGQDDLLQLVNDIIGQMKADGSLDKLKRKYNL